jgi:hypothetical protein
VNEDSLASRAETELRAQGLQRMIQDPSVVRLIASLLGVADTNAREKRLAEVRRERDPSWLENYGIADRNPPGTNRRSVHA